MTQYYTFLDVLLTADNRGMPLAGLQFRQGYGLRAYAAAEGLLREINNLKEFKRQGYGLGAAKICFKPQRGKK